MKKINSKLIILGSGPAGCTAAIYAARSGLNPIMINGSQPGGQLTITTDVENYPGFEDPVLGPDLMQNMIKQAENVGCQTYNEQISEINLEQYPYTLKNNSTTFITESIIIATGASAKWLGLKNEEKFRGHGVSACATCDAFFFKNKKVAVIGGGNTAVEEALFLTKFAKEVILIHRRDQLRAEKILQKRAFSNKKISFLWNSVVVDINGNETLAPTPLTYVSGGVTRSVLEVQAYDVVNGGVQVQIPGNSNTLDSIPYRSIQGTVGINYNYIVYFVNANEEINIGDADNYNITGVVSFNSSTEEYTIKVTADTVASFTIGDIVTLQEHNTVSGYSVPAEMEIRDITFINQAWNVKLFKSGFNTYNASNNGGPITIDPTATGYIKKKRTYTIAKGIIGVE